MNVIERAIIRAKLKKAIDNLIGGSNMSATWKQWLTGAANAVLSALTSGGISFGVGVTWQKALLIAGGSAVVSLGKWIAQHPLPGAE